MKYINILIGFGLLFLLFAVGAIGQEQKQVSEGSKIVESMDFNEIDLKVPEVGKDVARHQLDNGVVIYLYEDHKLPLFSLTTKIRCGSIYESKEKDGISSLVGTVMRTGGTKSVSGDSLNILLEYISGSLETSIGGESGSASLNILSKDIDMGMKLFADLLMNPAFPEDKIDLAKEEIKNQIKRRNDRPSGILYRYFNNILYGDHPYGWIAEWESIKNISRDDMIEYHKKYFVPNNIMIGISGDFNSDKMLATLTDLLGGWEKSNEPLPPYPEVKKEYKPGVFQVYKDINQANIRFGHLGIKRDNPDRYALNLMNFILGGGSFTSRMTSKVRSDEGLAYSVGTRYEIGSRDYGTFYAYCQTKSSTAYKAIDLMMAEIELIRDEGVTENELQDAKNSTINKFIFNFDNSGEIVSRLMNLEFNGYEPDYYKKYVDYYKAVTVDDIKRVANEYMYPDKMSIFVVGKPEDFEKPLDDFGNVINIELPEPVLE